MNELLHPSTPLMSAALEYTATLRAPARRSMLKTVRKFEDWCATEGLEASISQHSYEGFHEALQKSESKATASLKMRHLYYLGVRGPDPHARDYLFDNCLDLRDVGEVLEEPWWPNIPRLLASALNIPERRRVISELDNFFRWQQRVSGLPLQQRLNALYLGKSLSARTKYQRLSRLCRGLDAVLPGDPSLGSLREQQRRLYSQVWPHAEPKSRPARKLSEVEELLSDHRDPKTGKPCAEATLQILRSALTLHHDILCAAGRDLAFDKPALDLFADYAIAKNERYLAARDDTSAEVAASKSWCSRTVAMKCEALGRFISDPNLKRDWYRFAARFRKRGEQGEMKRKELFLASHPTDLNDLFLQANRLLHTADCELDIQKRAGIYAVIGALGILLFFPLRKSDLLALKIGSSLVREDGQWKLRPGYIRKTGEFVGELVLPEEAGLLLDASLLAGRRRDDLPEIYRRRTGTSLLKSPRRPSPYHSSAFGALFRRWTGVAPHLLRSLWCDEMVAHDADRMTVSAMLQHRSLISQKHYEVFAAKIRLLRAIEALRKYTDPGSD